MSIVIHPRVIVSMRTSDARALIERARPTIDHQIALIETNNLLNREEKNEFINRELEPVKRALDRIEGELLLAGAY